MAKSKTDENIMAAFAGESQARNKYTFFAAKAREAGLVQLANYFEETANNEMEHAEQLYKLLHDFTDPAANLKEAIKGEDYEWKEMYPSFEKVAREEGNKKAADLFSEIAKVERHHAARYRALLENVEKGTLLRKDRPVVWKCSKCGYLVEDKQPPEKCPVCGHERGYYELYCEKY